jgi:hypothetical protein
LKYQHLKSIAVVCAFAVLGWVWLGSGDAATYADSIEVETGLLAGNATAASHPEASSSGAVRFGGAYPAFSHLNVRDFGATPDDDSDDQTALQAALAAGKTQQKPVYMPAGTYKHSDRLRVDSVVVFGDSESPAVLRGTTFQKHAVDVTGTGAGLHNLVIEGIGKSPRTSDRGGNGIYIFAASGYVIRNCQVRNVTGAGIMTEDGHGGKILHNLVSLTGADGIYSTEGTSDLEVAYNRTVTTGDDGISFTSYASALGDVHGIVAHHNSVVGNFESRAMTINGGYDITLRDNYIDGGTAGISVTSVAEWLTRQSHDIEIYGNTIRNINQTRRDTGTIGGGALHLYNDLGGSDTAITMRDNRIYDPGLYGVYTGGGSTINATISNNQFWMDAGLTLNRNDNARATVTLSGNSRSPVADYPGDIITLKGGGLEPGYRYTPLL